MASVRACSEQALRCRSKARAALAPPPSACSDTPVHRPHPAAAAAATAAATLTLPHISLLSPSPQAPRRPGPRSLLALHRRSLLPLLHWSTPTAHASWPSPRRASQLLSRSVLTHTHHRLPHRIHTTHRRRPPL